MVHGVEGGMAVSRRVSVHTGRGSRVTKRTRGRKRITDSPVWRSSQGPKKYFRGWQGRLNYRRVP